MANKKLIEVSLQKSYKGELNSGLNSALFQDICETALEIISENERLKERLQISPQGDDKIDELEESINHFKFALDTKTNDMTELKRKVDNLYKAVCDVYNTTNDYNSKEKLDEFIGIF